MSSSDESPRSATPKILGLLALGVLAIAFAAALFGSLRSAEWRDGEEKGEIARRELARLEALVPRIRQRLAERGRLREALPQAPESELRVLQLVNLVELFAGIDTPSPPEPSRVPTREELDAQELWLDGLYRRLAAGRDAESRLPDLDAEIAALQLLEARSE